MEIGMQHGTTEKLLSKSGAMVGLWDGLHQRRGCLEVPL